MSSAPLCLRALLLGVLVCIAAMATTRTTFADEPDPAAEPVIEAVDWSKFQPAHTMAEMLRLKEGGVELVIIGGWHGDDVGLNTNCNHDLRLARAVGLKTAVYTVIDGPDGTSPEDGVLKALWACGREAANAQFIAIDAEIESASPERLRTAAFVVRLLGKTPVIYTAHWFWYGRFGNPSEACDLPLWKAVYDFNPDFNFAEQPYGCWAPGQVVGEQYSNESRFDGLVLDHSAFKQVFIDSLATPTPTSTPTPQPGASPSPTPPRLAPPTPWVRFLQNSIGSCNTDWMSTFASFLQCRRNVPSRNHP